MCGIAGVLALEDRAPDPAWAELLVRCLSHRGPDGCGTRVEPRLVLAHTRLAIIDTSEAGHQPMSSADGRHVLIVNGEIYNYASLREPLEREGFPFRSHSDTEVLVELLARDGTAALDRLRGMWALALWDRERGELLLARDRLGKRPLYLVREAGYLAFASEVQALLRLPFVRRRLDRARLGDYLRYLYVPSPHTLIEGMTKLEAGSWLRAAAGRDAPPQIERWWKLPEPDPAQRADAEWFETLDRELLESTRLRTVSDVPIGVFLSGGIDSNTVLDSLARIGHAPIRTFTVGFAGLPDERPLARAGSAGKSHEHTELVIEADLPRELPSILRHFGDPLGDSAVVTTALIAREASRHVKVILNGDGGDELFGGYARYPFARRADLAGAIPGARAVLELRAQGRPAQRAVLDALERGDTRAAARALGSVSTPAQLEELLGPPCREAAAADPEAPGWSGGGLTGATFAWDTAVYLPDDLLYKADTAGMAFALENRSPLLDHRLFEHVGRLPFARRAAAFTTKPLLRRLVRGRIPAAVLAARKRGFQLPLESWLHGPLRGWLDDLLRDPAATAPLFRPGAIASQLERFRAGHGDPLLAARLWSLAALEFWAREFQIETGT